MIMDSEAIHVAELLYGLAERMREERLLVVDRKIRNALDYCINMIELAAAHTALGYIGLDEADAIADAGELSLRRFRATRI